MSQTLATASRFLALYLAGTLLICIEFGEKSPAIGEKRPLKIVSCNDGDSCSALSPSGHPLRLRLAGIDAPEWDETKQRGQIFGKESREWLNQRLGGKISLVYLVEGDPYGRFLSWIYPTEAPGGPSVNEASVREGMAFAYRRPFVRRPMWKLFADAENSARKNKKGFWSQLSRPEAPWLYRNRFSRRR